MLVRYISIGLLALLAVIPRPCQAQEKKSEWSGLIFSKYYIDLDEGSDSYNAFDFERVYLRFTRKLGENWDLRLTTDVGRLMPIISVADSKRDDHMSVYMKSTYLERKNLLPNGSLYFGLQPTPTFSNIEKQWGYRSIQKTIFDYNGWSPSSDLGVAARAGFANGHGLYHLMVSNGPGYSHMETDKRKKLMAYVQYAPSAAFTIGVYGDIERMAPVDIYGNFNTFYVHGGVNAGPLALGGELIRRYQGKTGGLSAATFYGNVRVASRIKLLGRADIISPDKALADLEKYAALPYRFFIAGVDFDLGGGVDFIPNLQIETGEKDRKHLNMHLIVSF